MKNKSLLVLILVLLFWASASWSASLKGYEVGRIYRDGKQTVVDVTYWEYSTQTDTVAYSVMVEKSVITKTLVDYPDTKLSADVTVQLTSRKVADITQIQINGISAYTYNVRGGIIAKEKITWNKDVTEADIYTELNNRLTNILPTATIIPEQVIKVTTAGVVK